jgi:predicted nucleic acid-binding protein
MYLDNNVINRPFDDQRQGRIWIETLSFSLILGMVESGEAELIASAVHRFENSAAPDPFRREWVERILKMASIEAPLTESVRVRARQLEQSGLKPLDALHVSSAEAAEADYFVSCDDRLLKRYNGKMKALSPTQFVSMSH